MNFLHLLLAWRYILGARHEKSIAAMAYISFFGILIGTFSLALTLFIMHGFERATHEQLQGVHAHVIMRGYGDQLNAGNIIAVLEKEFQDTVIAASPTTTQQIIIQPSHSSESTHLVVLKGIDPHQECCISTLEKKIITPPATLVGATHNDHLLLGARLAQDMGVQLGDPITLLIPDTDSSSKRSVQLTQHQALVGGLFNTGIDEFDTGIIFCSLDLLHTLFPESGITQINLKLNAGVNDEKVVANLRHRFGIEVYSWKELYPALVSALKLEKYVMAFILALITLIASMNIIALFFMQITQKRGDIAILFSMGIRSVRPIFLLMSVIITGIASLCGLLLAGIVGLLLDTYPLITLPDAYYVSKLPIALEWHLAGGVFIFVMIASIIATWIPLRTLDTINIAHTVRFEA